MKQLNYILFTLSFLLFYACSESFKETQIESPAAPENPFSGIDYSPDVNETPELDSTSFLALHHYIFSQSCNQPGCHDGSFEPDFRTVESAYNSLVLHTVKKNYEVDPMPFRVTPGSPENSMMWHRITEHNPPNFELMPSSGEILPDDYISNIRTWIENGARDIYDNPPTPISAQPNCWGLLAFHPELNDYRLDTIRGGVNYNPFAALVNQEISIWFTYTDSNELNNEISNGANLTYNKVKLSLDRFDFSNAVTFDLNIAADPLSGQVAFSSFSEDVFDYYHNFSFKPTDYGFNTGDQIFIRTYVQDEDHESPFENPEDESIFFLKSYFSIFLVE